MVLYNEFDVILIWKLTWRLKYVSPSKFSSFSWIYLELMCLMICYVYLKKWGDYKDVYVKWDMLLWVISIVYLVQYDYFFLYFNICVMVLFSYLFLATLSTWVIALFLYVCLSYLCWLICVTTSPFFLRLGFSSLLFRQWIHCDWNCSEDGIS